MGTALLESPISNFILPLPTLAGRKVEKGGGEKVARKKRGKKGGKRGTVHTPHTLLTLSQFFAERDRRREGFQKRGGRI